MKGLLSPDSKFGRLFYSVGYLIILSWLWLLCCIPVFTIGAASTALYDMTRRVVNGTERKVVADYFASFRANFKQTTPLWLCILLVCAVLVYSLGFFMFLNNESTLSKLIILLIGVIIACFLCWVHVVFAYIARFQDTVKTAAMNSFIMCILNPLSSVWIIVQGAAIVYLISAIPFITWLPTIVSLAPGCYCALAVTPIERIFKQYIPKDDADVEN